MTDNGFVQLSTRRLPVKKRFDYWRSLHNLIDIDVPKGACRTGFRADLLHYLSADGTRLGHASNDDTVGRFSNANEDFFLFSVTMSGSVELTTKDGLSRLVTPASGLVVIDSTHQMETRSSRYEHIYLTVPRAQVPQQSVAALNEGAYFLHNCGMARILTSHMIQIVKEHDQLSPQAALTVVGAARDLALALLDFLRSAGQGLQHDHPDHAVWMAARRFIDLHLADATMTAEKIALSLNCSRAHLYRVFAQRGEKIGHVVRAARLERASI